MELKKILQKAIEKAIGNGFNYKQFFADNWDAEMIALDLFANFNENFLIFNHEFAKAFWGENILQAGWYSYFIPKWQYHLQQMVLCEEPLKYLEKFL